MTKAFDKFILPTIIIVVMLIAFVLVTIAISLNRFTDEIARSSTHTASRGVLSYIESYEYRLSTAANDLANDRQFIQLMQSGNHDELLRFLSDTKAYNGVEFYSVISHDGRVLLRTHATEYYGDIFSDSAFELVQVGRYLVTYYSSAIVPMSIAKLIPIYHNDIFIGALQTGIRLSTPEFLSSMSQRFNAHLTFYYDSRAVASTFPEFHYDMGHFADDEILDAVLQDGGLFTRCMEISGIRYTIYHFPLINSNNETVGMVSVAFSREYLDAMDDGMMRIIITMGVVAAIIAITLVLVINRRIANPIIEANKRVNLMFNASPIAVFLYDKDFTALDCNIKALELFKFSTKEYALAHYNDPLPPTQPNGTNSQEAVKALMTEAFRTGMATTEFMLKKVNGAPLPVELHYVRIKHNGTDALAEYIIDLTNQKASEKMMQETQKFNQVILNSAPLMIAIFDSNLETLYVNQQALDLLQVANMDTFKSSWRNLSPEFQPCGTNSKSKTEEVFNEAFRTGNSTFEWVFRNYLDNELIPMEVTLKRFYHQGADLILAYVFDLRPVKKAMQLANEKEKQAQTAMEETLAKSRFLAQISHEIRTPMNAVLGIAEIQLQEENLPKNLKESLSHIRTSSYHLLAIINNLLDMSKAEAGKMEILNNPYETISMIVNTMQINMFYIGSKQIEFKIKVDSNLPLAIIGDELRIKQILNNALSNAFKYTTEGSVVLSLGIEQNVFSAPDEFDLIISVEDTGRGMTQDQINQLFGEEYLRFNEKDSIEGSGLGLIITHHLIKMMDGKIDVSSEVDKGTTITVQIPQKAVTDEVIGEELSHKLQNFEFTQMSKYQIADFTREQMPYGRVLVVDDIELNLYVAKGHLTPYKLDVDTAISGFETIEKIEAGEDYDIIFMDHMMPEMDGVETVIKLRASGYEGIIVALTANALIGNFEIFLKHGFDDFVSKPIDLKDLNQILNKYVRDRHPEEAEKHRNMMLIENMEVTGGVASDQETEPDRKMLELFQNDAENAITALHEASKNEDVEVLTATAHAIKSALAYIGENELSEDAAKLEAAGKNEDLEYIGSNIDTFVESLEDLLERLKLQKPESDAEPGTYDDMDFLVKSLREVESACEEYDVKAAVAKIEALQEKPWNEEITASLKNIHNMLFLNSDFDAAIDEIKELLSD